MCGEEAEAGCAFLEYIESVCEHVGVVQWSDSADCIFDQVGELVAEAECEAGCEDYYESLFPSEFPDDECYDQDVHGYPYRDGREELPDGVSQW